MNFKIFTKIVSNVNLSKINDKNFIITCNFFANKISHQNIKIKFHKLNKNTLRIIQTSKV